MKFKAAQGVSCPRSSQGPAAARRNPRRTAAQRGIALIVTLILLSVITFLTVAFLFLARRERGSVANAVDQNTARLAAEAAMERARAEIYASIRAGGSRFAYDFRVSTNYINPAGFQPGISSPVNVNYDYLVGGGTNFTADQRNQNINNLYYSPRPPVFVTNKRTGITDFRYWLDLNRNGRFEPTGLLPELDGAGNLIMIQTTNGAMVLSNNVVGDPQWIGLTERAGLSHMPNNKYLSRFAFCIVPSGLTLDINTIHNAAGSQSFAAGNEGYARNQGVGPWELNLAAFLRDLNTNQWLGYTYNTPLGPRNDGVCFEDAQSILSFRYGRNYNNQRSFSAMFPSGTAAFGSDLIDGLADGALMGINAPTTDNDNAALPWPGAENVNLFFTAQDLFNPAMSSPNFVTRLSTSGADTSSYDRYTYYRLLSQLGTDSGPEPAKLHLNYDNVDAAGQIVPDAQVNFVPWAPGRFFTNAADRLLRATFSNVSDNRQLFGVSEVLSITNIPVMVSNRFVYSPSLHRVLQLAANIYDASTNRVHGSANGPFLPTVFSPVFRTDADGAIFIEGFEELTDSWEAYSARPLRDPNVANAAATLAPRDRVMGVPLVVGAKKGFPNFNQFAVQTVSEVSRKVALRRSSIAQGVRPSETNQMYVVGVSNAFAIEAWNSYRTAYPRAVDIYVTNYMVVAMRFTNDALLPNQHGTVGPVFTTRGAVTNIPAGGWPGTGGASPPAKRSFIIPLQAGDTFRLASSPVPTSQFIYRMPVNRMPYWDPDLSIMNPPGSSGAVQFERTRQFAIPELRLAVTNRLLFVMVDHETRRIVDYVTLNALGTERDLISDIGGANIASESKLWDRKRLVGTNQAVNRVDVPYLGLIRQLEESLGQPSVNAASWTDYNVAVQDKDKAIDAFRLFCGLSPLKYPATAFPGLFNNIEMQAPFIPSRRLVQESSWQANDPLVHYTPGDLTYLARGEGKNAEVRMLTRVQGIPPMNNIGDLNDRYEPWGGRPSSSSMQSPAIDPFNLRCKDPGIRSSDDWNFPAGKFPTVGWLGRVHRGTPWQTVYLKSSTSVRDRDWLRWTGNPSKTDADKARPLNDRLLFDLFTTAFDAGSTRGQLNVNQDGLAAWSAALSGIIALTNSASDRDLDASPPQVRFDTAILQPAGSDPGMTNSPVGKIWNSIKSARTSRGGHFARLGDVLAAPALTEQSPLLNLSSATQRERGVDDAAYERIPQLLLGLLRGADNPRFTIYAYGQSLKPADNSIVRSGTYMGLCTNYQITAEYATRSVVRMDLTNGAWKAVIESFNVLPPEE